MAQQFQVITVTAEGHTSVIPLSGTTVSKKIAQRLASEEFETNPALVRTHVVEVVLVANRPA